jgi:hypothetical protein
MAIQFACPNCGKGFSVKDELAGKRSKCPACATMLVVPRAPKKISAVQEDRLPEPPPPPPSAPAAEYNPFAFDDTTPAVPAQYQAPSPVHYSEPTSGANGTPALVGEPKNWRGAHGGLLWLRSGSLVQVVSILIVMAVVLLPLILVTFGHLFGMAVISFGTGLQGNTLSPAEKRDLNELVQSIGLALTIGLIVLAITVVIAMFTGEVFRVIGFCQMLGVPSECGAKMFGVGALFGEIALVLMPVARIIFTLVLLMTVGAGAGFGWVVTIASWAFEIFAALLPWLALYSLLLYLRKVAVSLNSDKLRGRIFNVFIWSIITPVIFVLTIAGFFAGLWALAAYSGPGGLQMIHFHYLLFGTVVILDVVLVIMMFKYVNLISLGAHEVRKRGLGGMRI